MTVQAELIYQPAGGAYPERIFNTPEQDFTIRSWSWVLFTKPDGTEWAGSFRGGQGSKRFAAVLKDLPIVFIVADGQGYIVHAETEALLGCTKEDNIREAIHIPDTPLVIYATIWGIYIADHSLEVKELVAPFEFYFVWFRKVSGHMLEIEYEEMYTGDFKTIYLDTKSLEFNTTA